MMIRNCLGHQIPKIDRMIELAEMTQLMHDDILRQMLRQQGDAIIEVQAPPTGAAAPSGFLIAYGDLAHRKMVVRMRVESSYFLSNKCMRIRLVQEIMDIFLLSGLA